MAFNDAQCPRCDRKIGWVGSVENCPPCTGCGYQIPLEELKIAEEEMRIAEESILKMNKGKKQTFE
jgi:hypothetical protein